MASQVQHLREEITAVTLNASAAAGDEVVVLLMSGGGTVGGYGLAAAQLERLKEHGLRLTVCVDEVAASGGFMMAAVADHIIASPFAVLGSVGVVSTQPNVTKLLDTMGVEVEDVTAGQFKRTMVPYKLPSAEDRAKVQQEVDVYHQSFKEHLKKHRGSKGLDVDKIATGETWFGAGALQLKLIDEMGTSDAFLVKLMNTDNKEVLFVKHSVMKRGLFGQWQPQAEASVGATATNQLAPVLDVLLSAAARAFSAYKP